MTQREPTGSIRALLDEYKKAINELIGVIEPLNEKHLSVVVDGTTSDPDCHSIQTILAHVVCSGYGYTIDMENATGLNKPRPEREILNDVNQYIDRLRLMFTYCEIFFKANPTLPIEQTDNAKKITVKWGQQYDIEQLMEHAIVHVLRHRRQIEHFIQKQSEQAI
jgi:uncharacterized damage-inducible protein DinB